MMPNLRGTARYKKARAALKARARFQNCWRCGRALDAEAPHHAPNSITLGHIVAYIDAPDLFYEPTNHAPECPSCNYSDGARRGNGRRLGNTRISHSSRNW